MKILFLTQVLPYPLDAGAKVRQYHMLRWLAERHEVTLVSFVRADDRQEAVAHLRTICAAVHVAPLPRSMWRNVRAGVRGLLTGLPMTIVRDETAEMTALVRGLAAEVPFDVVHADQLSMAWWGRLAVRAAAAARGGRAPRSLLDEHNAIYLLAERMAATERHPLRRLLMRREAAAFRRYEAAMLASYDAVLTVTEEDRGHLEALLRSGHRAESILSGTEPPSRAGGGVQSKDAAAPDDRSAQSILSGTEPPSHAGGGVQSKDAAAPDDRAAPSILSGTEPPSDLGGGVQSKDAAVPDDRSAPSTPPALRAASAQGASLSQPTNLQPGGGFGRPNLQPGKITVIPICVDPDAVAPVPHAPSGAPTILHLGTMFWPPNVTGVLWFAREVLPLVHRAVPDARFVIVGKNPPPEVQALAADPHIEVTGYVADVTPYLAAADAFVVPLHAGGGMRVKILDAWLWGLPIVSTPIGAEGIEVVHGENILIAGGPAAEAAHPASAQVSAPAEAASASARAASAPAEAASAAAAAAFAAATVRLLTDGALNASLRRNGRAWVEANYAWRTVYRRVDAVYERLRIEVPGTSEVPGT